MGHGWKECDYNKLVGKHRCKCGAGFIYDYEHISEESDLPPFEMSDRSFSTNDCPNRCCESK